MLRSIVWTMCLVLGLTNLSHAGILGMQQFAVDFTKPDEAARRITWSDRQYLGMTAEGFGWDADVNMSRDGWIETEPLGIGTSWRPTNSAQIRLKLGTNYPAVVKTGENSKAFYVPSVYVRHSPDRVHWSDWQPLELSEDPRNPGTVQFTGRVGVAGRSSRDYYDRLQTWSRRDDVKWASDEEEFCTWLVAQEPEYFAKQRPFVGYVQLLIEGSFRGSQRLKSFDAEISWGVGGVHALPKDPAAEKRHHDREGGDTGWRFQGKK